jgi:hypothetical protein
VITHLQRGRTGIDGVLLKRLGRAEDRHYAVALDARYGAAKFADRIDDEVDQRIQ